MLKENIKILLNVMSGPGSGKTTPPSIRLINNAPGTDHAVPGAVISSSNYTFILFRKQRC